MTSEDFFITVCRMREAQKQYFAIAAKYKAAIASDKAIIKEQLLIALMKSKEIESIIDSEIEKDLNIIKSKNLPIQQKLNF